MESQIVASFEGTGKEQQISGDAAQASKPTTVPCPLEAAHSAHLLTGNQYATTSRFTYHDLNLMKESSAASPLRVVALVDFDAFYAQCETVHLGLPTDQPLAVQQWHAVIAVNYPAREYGVRRGMPVDEVKMRCPSIKLQHVATWRKGEPSWAYRADVLEHLRTDKAALEAYQIESRKALTLVSHYISPLFGAKLEKASVDEMFLDLSSPVHRLMTERYPQLSARAREHRIAQLPQPPSDKLGWDEDSVVGGHSVAPDWDEIALSIGANIVREIRRELYRSLHYTTSAGVASNKVLAKLCAGYRKPNQQTVIPSQNMSQLLSRTKYRELRGLGRCLGERVVEAFGGETTADLLVVPLATLQDKLGRESGTFVYQLIRGQDSSEVASRTDIQSMLSQKTFAPTVADLEEASRWLRIFAAELNHRVTDLDTPSCRRRPRTLVVHHHINGRFGATRVKQISIPPGSLFDEELIYTLSQAALESLAKQQPSWPCAALGVRLSNFQELEQRSQSIRSYFSPKETTSTEYFPTKPLGQIGDTSMPRYSKHSEKRLNMSSRACEGLATSEMLSTGGLNLQVASELDGLYQCPKCSARILEVSVLEHLDWHVAKELQAASS